jgi:hypothetical protein
MGGNLGFLINYNSNSLVVFINNSKYDKDIIVGFNSRLPKNCTFLYLDKKLTLNPHIVLENTKFRYGKIALSEKTILDYENLTLWFSARKYKLIRQIFEQDTEKYTKEDLISKAVNLSEIFN